METQIEDSASGTLELSVVIPCLNEHETVGMCVAKAVRAMRQAGIAGEVILADNGSSDGSQQIAQQAGARVVAVAAKGYGNALMGGIEAARGRFIIMGDADDSYDFLELPRFVEKLRQGAQLVQGCRLPSGGGTVLPGAMPPLHRWLGNPMFSAMARFMFGSRVHDVYCGLRGFTREMYQRLNLRCAGMEFATEMIIKASLFGESIDEVPITLHPDGRQTRRPHLRTFRDGWRTLRFFLLFSPRWLFIYPGIVLMLLGLLGYALALPGARIFGAVLDAHTLLFASLAILVGFQILSFGVFARIYAQSEGFLPPQKWLDRQRPFWTLEKTALLGLAVLLGGTVPLGMAVWQWVTAHFGPLNYAHTMRLVVPGVTTVALGFEMIFSSFLISILGVRQR